jgi:hypothetical protein
VEIFLRARPSLLVVRASRVGLSLLGRQIFWPEILLAAMALAWVQEAAMAWARRVWALVDLVVELRGREQRPLGARLGRRRPWIGAGSGGLRGAFLLRGQACRSRFRIDGRPAG